MLWGGFIAVPFAHNLADSATTHIMIEAELGAIFVSPEGKDRFTKLAAMTAAAASAAAPIIPCVGNQTIFQEWLLQQPPPPPSYKSPNESSRLEDAAVVIAAGSTYIKI